MKLNLILLALGIALTVSPAQAQNKGTEGDFVKPIVPTFSLVVAKITSQEAGFDTRNNHLVNALYVSGTFTNTNTLAINLHSYHVTGLDANEFLDAQRRNAICCSGWPLETASQPVVGRC